MRKTILKLFAATAVLAAPAAAQAAHIVYYGAMSQATVATLNDGRIGIRNGAQDLYYGDNGAVGTSQGGWQNNASTQSNGNVATSSANLVDGTLHAYTSEGSEFYSAASFADARFSDSVWFTNTTDADIALTVRFTLDGTIKMEGPWESYAAVDLSACSACANDTGELIHFADGSRAANTQYMVMGENGIRFAESTGISGPSVHYTYGSTYDAGFMTGFYQTTLYIPKGLTTLGVSSVLNLDCRGVNTSCDFGHTGAISFGPLADGLSYSSASGAFLTAVNAAPGGVPEPATWAMMICGFGLAGSALRARRNRLA